MKFVDSENPINVFIGGIGSGKTFAGGIKSLIKAKVKGSFGLITAPIESQLQKYTLKEILGVWEKLGIRYKEHYVMNVKPPTHWKVEPYSISSNHGVITTRWGSYILVKSSHNFQKFKGSQFDWILGDELSLFPKGAFELLIGRLRGETYKDLGIQSTFDGLTNPPADIGFIKDLENAGANIIQSKTSDNIKHLPVGYIERQKDILDERTYRREILGEIIPPTLNIFYNYGEHNHTNLTFSKEKATYLTFDFNVNPMTCLVLQEHCVVKEFQIFESNTEDTGYKVYSWLKENGFTGDLYITGDPSGSNRSTQSANNNFTILANIFKEFNTRVWPAPRKSIQYGENCIASALKTAFGSVKLKLNVEQAKVLHKNLQIVTREDYEKGDPNNVTHNIDALRYYGVMFLPIKREI